MINQLTIILLSEFWKIILPESIFILSVLVPEMGVLIYNEVCQVVVIEDLPRDIICYVWSWVAEINVKIFKSSMQEKRIF